MRISDWSSDVCSSDLAAASGGFEGGTERNLGGRGDVTACLDPDIFAPVAAELLGAKLRAADRALAGNVIPDIASGDHCIQSRTKLRGSAKSHDRYSLGRGDRKSVVWGKRVSVRVGIGGRRI